SHQCAWYALGRRETKTFAELDAAKLFAQRKSSSFQNELPDSREVSYRDVEIMLACEGRAKRFGLGLVSAFEEWCDAKSALKGGSLPDAVRFYNAHHAGLPNKTFAAVADECLSAKEAAGISEVYQRSLKHYLARMK